MLKSLASPLLFRSSQRGITATLFAPVSWKSGNSCFSSTSSSSSSSTDATTSSSGSEEKKQLVQWKVSESNSHIGFLTLHSAKTYNALTVEMGKEFSAVVHDIVHNVLTQHDVRVIILSGEGTQAFSAGGNLDWLRSLKQNSVHKNADLMLSFYKSFLCIREAPVPVIAAMNGPAVGAGAGLALACDLRVGVPKANLLGLNFTKLGIHSGMGGSHFLRNALPSSTALNEILLAGKSLSGQEAMDLGLLNRLAPVGGAVPVALEMAEDLVQRHPLALRMVVQTLRAQQDLGLQQALQREALAQAICYNREDWGEGVNATAEKRQPAFRGYHDH